MNDALEKVRGVRELPLFPLPVVLFPGAPMPLHIFEPRYRRMLADVRASNNLFGLSYFNPEQSAAGGPPAGSVGCAAEVVEVEPLADGRSNIVVVGVARYELEAYAGGAEPYLVGRVSFFADEAEDAELLERRAREVLALFTRIAEAVRVLNDERASLPELPEAPPERLSFLVAAALELDVETRQELLEMRSTFGRLSRLRNYLEQAVGGYEERARMHRLAKGNGHAGRRTGFEG
jgi:Lon protease-like protein